MNAFHLSPIGVLLGVLADLFFIATPANGHSFSETEVPCLPGVLFEIFCGAYGDLLCGISRSTDGLCIGDFCIMFGFSNDVATGLRSTVECLNSHAKNKLMSTN